MFRSSYQHDKMVAASAKKIFTGERLAPIKKVPNDLSLWLLVMGEGFGKMQYRFVNFFYFHLGFDYMHRIWMLFLF